jgi:hypothetical protein
MYAQGLSAFWVGADWIFSEQGGEGLPFEIGVVPWPIGPGGCFQTGKHGSTHGSWYFIPQGTPEPRFVYDVYFEWMNWFDYDTELAVNLEWSRNNYMNERNFNYAYMMSRNTGFDIWNSIGLSADMFSMVPIMQGERTAAQYAEKSREIIQSALDKYFG